MKNGFSLSQSHKNTTTLRKKGLRYHVASRAHKVVEFSRPSLLFALL